MASASLAPRARFGPSQRPSSRQGSTSRRVASGGHPTMPAAVDGLRCVISTSCRTHTGGYGHRATDKIDGVISVRTGSAGWRRANEQGKRAVQGRFDETVLQSGTIGCDHGRPILSSLFSVRSLAIGRSSLCSAPSSPACTLQRIKSAKITNENREFRTACLSSKTRRDDKNMHVYCCFGATMALKPNAAFFRNSMSSESSVEMGCSLDSCFARYCHDEPIARPSS